MEIIIGVVVVIAVIIIFGNMKGPPEPSSMSIEGILARMRSEGAWIERYNTLPNENREGAGIKKQYEGKKLYVMQLQLELMKRGTDQEKETLIPVLQRAIELMRNGMGEKEAHAQASNEYVQKRDAKASQSQKSAS